MPLSDLDFDNCDEKKCSTSGGVIFNCDNPCLNGAAFDYTTGTCEGDDVCDEGLYKELRIFSYPGQGGFQASGVGFSECSPIPSEDGSSECADLGRVAIECDSTWSWAANATGTDSITGNGSCEFIPTQVDISWTEYILVITDRDGNDSFASYNGDFITYRTGFAYDRFLGDGQQKSWHDGITAEVRESGGFDGTGLAPYEGACTPPDNTQCSAC